MVVQDDRDLTSRINPSSFLNHKRLMNVTPVQKQAGRNKDEYEQ